MRPCAYIFFWIPARSTSKAGGQELRTLLCLHNFSFRHIEHVEPMLPMQTVPNCPQGYQTPNPQNAAGPASSKSKGASRSVLLLERLASSTIGCFQTAGKAPTDSSRSYLDLQSAHNYGPISQNRECRQYGIGSIVVGILEVQVRRACTRWKTVVG